MSVHSTRNNYMPDLAGPITLRKLSDGADSAFGYSHADTVEVRRASPRWAEAQPLEQSWTVEGYVGSINASADSTFTLEISASLTSGGTRTLLASVPLTAVGPFTLNVDSNQLPTGANFLHVGMRIGGALLPHSINWSAQLRPNPSLPSNVKG